MLCSVSVCTCRTPLTFCQRMAKNQLENQSIDRDSVAGMGEAGPTRLDVIKHGCSLFTCKKI